MSLSSKHSPRNQSLLIEGAEGVTEYLVAVVHVNGKPMFGPVGARIASGMGCELSLAELQEAIALQGWAEENADVFHEGRVAYPF